MPAHTIHTTYGDVVLIGASAGDDDMRTAIRTAAAQNCVLRLCGVADFHALARIVALAEGYGWSPTFRFPRVDSPDIVDMLLGGGL